MNGAPLHLAGERLLLDPCGAVFWPAQRLLAVADLHLEKGTALAARGQLVPPWDTAATLERLAGAIRLYRPDQVILLGDSFHDCGGATRIARPDQARLAQLAQHTRFTWILGNHDPALPGSLPGEMRSDLLLAGLHFRHQAAPAALAVGAQAELCGHHHPKALLATRAATITRPCFVASTTRLMLPAFGAYTGGLDVRHPAIAGLFPRGGRVFLLGRDRLFSFTLAHALAQAGGRPPSGGASAPAYKPGYKPGYKTGAKSETIC